MKNKLLVAPLLAIPLLASCNNGGGNKPSEVKFSLSSDHPIEVVDKTAKVYVDWSPTDKIQFKSFTFKASPSKGNTVSFDQTGDPRPMPVTITFDNDITEDINGTLSFNYEDVTMKTTVKESSLTFTIPKPTSDPYFVTEDEFNAALSFEGVTYAQFNTVEDSDHGAITRENAQFSPNKFHLESHNFRKGGDIYNCDIYVTKNTSNAGGYTRYQPITNTTLFTNPYINCLGYTDNAWEVVTDGVTQFEFKTPKSYVDFSGITYDANTYDPITHYFVIDGNYFQFENKKLTIAHNTAANMTVNIDYEEDDIVLPEVTDPTYTVDETVWETYKNGMLLDSDMATFMYDYESSGIGYKKEMFSTYSKDLMSGFNAITQDTTTNTIEAYFFHETTQDIPPQDIYYCYAKQNSTPYTKVPFSSESEWFNGSPTGAIRNEMYNPVFTRNLSDFQYDSHNHLYRASHVELTSGSGLYYDLQVSFINNQLVCINFVPEVADNPAMHLDVFAKNCFIEVPYEDFPTLN